MAYLKDQNIMHWTEKMDPAYSIGDWVVRVAKGGSHVRGTVGQIMDYGDDPNLYVVEVPGDGHASVGWFDTTFRAATEDEIEASGGGSDPVAEDEAPVEPYLEVLRRIADSLEVIAATNVDRVVRPDTVTIPAGRLEWWADPSAEGFARPTWDRPARPVSPDVMAAVKADQRARRARRRSK